MWKEKEINCVARIEISFMLGKRAICSTKLSWSPGAVERKEKQKILRSIWNHRLESVGTTGMLVSHECSELFKYFVETFKVVFTRFGFWVLKFSCSEHYEYLLNTSLERVVRLL